MKRKLSRRDFIKLAGAGAAASAVVGYGVYRESSGEPVVERTPFAVEELTANLDGLAPILIVTSRDSQSRFGAYLAEILRAEGVNCFHKADIASLTLELVRVYDVVILAEMSLTNEQIQIFEGYVSQGGKLVAMKPAEGLASVFGVERAAGTLSDAYLRTAAEYPACKGINPSTLQFHGDADLYDIVGAEGIAWLYVDRETLSPNPAITINRFGTGRAVAFAYNLPQSIALMRQGNPKLVDQDIDGIPGVRTVDKFVGWIDLDRIHIPQADEQQRLFVNILAQLSKKPLPRIWYFPEDKKSVLIATGDCHGNPAQFIEEVLTRVDARRGHFTIFYGPQIVSDIGRAERWVRFWLTDHVPVVGDILSKEFVSPTPHMVANWRARGHEFALHPYVDVDLESDWLEYWKEFTGRGYAPVPPTVRTHRILWKGWTETARWQASLGIRMNFDYYHVGPSLQKGNSEWPNGHLTGSGRPMKFIDDQGRVLDIYQQLTHVTDEHLIPMDVPGWGGWPKLTAQQAVEVSKYMLDRSVKNGDYCAICGQFHVDPLQVGGDPAEKSAIFLDGTLDYAQELGVPIISGQEWLAFTDLRHDADFTDLTWDSNSSTLTFNLLPPDQTDSTLTILLPAHYNERFLVSASVDGVATPINSRLDLGGMEYVLIIVNGQEHRFQANYS